MRIRFDVEYDGYPWPGPLLHADAAFGQIWTGPHGLLGLLETQLGLGGPTEPDSLRAAALVSPIQRTKGFWSDSASVDPIGVAAELLRWRDDLWAAGWRGQGLSTRLKDIAQLIPAVIPGTADRLIQVTEKLQQHKTDLQTLELVEPRAGHSRVWKDIFVALQASGVNIVELPPESVQAKGDLLAAQSKNFSPQADGSLQLFRCLGPQLAADAIAAWLAVAGSLDGTVVISPDPLLDSALHRYGLPTLGATSGREDCSLLQILPLVIQMGWSPADPARALELLTLPVSPVPKAIRWRLVAALQQWPAVDSDDWRKALKDGLDKEKDAKRRKSLTERLDVLLKPSVPVGQLYPIPEMNRRTSTLMAWLHGMAVQNDNPDKLETPPGIASLADDLTAAIIQCGTFIRLLDLMQLKTLTQPQLQRVLDAATGSVPAIPRFAAQAGLGCVTRPGAIGGPAQRIVWWNFTRDSAPRPQSLPLTRFETQALAAAGIDLLEPAQVATNLNTRWSRPLRFAESALMLVCPRYGDAGEEQHPHPLWDQIVANASATSKLRVLEVDQPIFAKTPQRKKHELLTAPRPRIKWHLPKGMTIPPRETESPTAAGGLVGCPFQWTMSYAAGISEGATAELPAGDRLVGTVAHEIIARLLKSGIKDPDRAEQEAERLFDQEGPRLAAPLFMAGAERLKQKSRRATARAAKSLFQYLRTAKLGVVAVEKTVASKAFGTKFAGRPDVVVGPPNAIIDLKWDGEKYRKEELESGAAFQLAAYAHLIRADGYVPPVAFFIIRTQRMLTTSAGLFPDVMPVNGVGPDETWRAFERAYSGRRKEMADGIVLAPGEGGAEGDSSSGKSGLKDGKLLLPAPCHFCSFGLLCGHGIGGEPADESAKEVL